MERWIDKWVAITNPEDYVGQEIVKILADKRMMISAFATVHFPAIRALADGVLPSFADVTNREHIREKLNDFTKSESKIPVFIHNCGSIVNGCGSSSSNVGMHHLALSTRHCISEAFDAMCNQGVDEGIILVIYSNADPPTVLLPGFNFSPRQVNEMSIAHERSFIQSQERPHNIRLLALSHGILEKDTVVDEEENRGAAANSKTYTPRDIAKTVVNILGAEPSQVSEDAIMGIHWAK